MSDETTKQPGAIYALMAKVMADIGAVGKDKKNPQQGYNFRGVDDIMNAVHGAMAKHGVICAPEVLREEREERQTKSGGALIYTRLVITHRFFAPDGSCVEATTAGEGMDSGDKSTNKAMSAALKYALLIVFMIPTVELADSESESHEVAARSNASAHRTPPADDGEKRSAPAEEHAAPPVEKERTPEDEAIRQAWGKIYGAIENVFGIDDKDGKRAKARELAAQEYPDRKPGTLTVAELDAIRNVINRRADMAASDLPFDNPAK